MVLSLLGQLADLSDAELDALAVAIGTEQARRANPGSAAEEGTGAEPAAEPDVAEVPDPVYVTRYGGCWHQQ